MYRRLRERAGDPSARRVLAKERELTRGASSVVCGFMSQASPSRAARRTPASVLAASQIGGRGRCSVRHRDPHAAQGGACPDRSTGSPLHRRSSAPQAFFEATDSLARVHTHRLVLGGAIAETHADDQPPAADHVQRGELLREVDRLVQREQQHAGAELHALGLGGHAPERRQGLEVRRPGRRDDARFDHTDENPTARARRTCSTCSAKRVACESSGRCWTESARPSQAWVGGIYARLTAASRPQRGLPQMTLVCPGRAVMRAPSCEVSTDRPEGRLC